MSILAYTGMPGSGKSYDTVANQILPALQAGRKVVTNIPLVKEEFDKLGCTGELVDLPIERVAQSPETIQDFCTAGSVVIIDEVWRLFPAGLKANKVPEPYKQLLAEHRHMVDADGNSMQIVLVTQDLAQISAFARQLVEQTFVHTKLTHMGMAKRYRVDIYHGAVTGLKPNIQNRLREIYGTYDKKYFKLYQSHTMSEKKEDAATNESMVDARGNVLKKPVLIIGAVFIVFAVIYGFYGVTSFFNPEPERFAQAASVATGLEQPRHEHPHKIESRGSLPLLTYTLAGFVDTGKPETSYGLIFDSGHLIRVPFSSCWSEYSDNYICTYKGVKVSRLGVTDL